MHQTSGSHKSGPSILKSNGGTVGPASPRILDHRMVERYHKQGYLTLRNFATVEEVNLLRIRAEELLSSIELEESLIFTPKDHGFANREYFQASAGNISFFFEENAFDDDGNFRQDKSLSVNKIGHALHDLDPAFRSYSRSTKVKELLEDLNIVSPTPIQSMYICKQPRIGGEVVSHQDSTFLYTDPPSVTGLWLALEDATVENGCLFVLPGSHKHGIDRRLVRLKDGQTDFDGPPKTYCSNDFKALEVPAGTLVILHGAVVHQSSPNTSPKSRHAYSVHYIDGTSHWDEGNWLQRQPDFPFKPLESMDDK